MSIPLGRLQPHRLLSFLTLHSLHGEYPGSALPNCARARLTTVLEFSLQPGEITENPDQNGGVLIDLRPSDNTPDSTAPESHRNGLPSKYYPGPTLLNFGDLTRTGAFNVV